MNAVDLAIGCYTPATGGSGSGILLARWDGSRLTRTAELPADSPSFLAWSADGRTLFAAEETTPGAILSVAVSSDGTGMRRTGAVAGLSGRPCHIAVHSSGRFLAASCYGGGAFETAGIAVDGGLIPHVPALQHNGHGLHPTRQDRPHPHSVLFTPDGTRAVLIDIGTDSVALHAVADSRLTAQALSTAYSAPGAGPRHGRWLGAETLAVVEEISATVSLFRVDGGRIARVTEGIPTTSTAAAAAWPSEIVSIPGGLAIANRSPGSIVEFTRRGDTLKLVAELPLEPGGNLRHLAVLPDSRYALALQDADRIVVVERDGGVVAELATGSPSCIAIRASQR